jgi:hypothetical protein
VTIYDGRVETSEEEALREWFDKQVIAAPDNLEAAARHIITLASSLLTLLFAVLAVAGDPLPPYFAFPGVRWLGVAAVLLLLLALAAALGTVFPYPWAANSARPDEQRVAFRRLLARKSRFMRVAAISFFLGLVALGTVLAIALLKA